jgi:copper(I)-binding protein
MRIVAAVLMGVVMPAVAGVTVKDAWVRGTVPGQDTTGAFMTVTSSEDAKLVEASSPIAKMTEIHQTMLMNGVNHMHPVEGIALPAGKAVKLESGGYHMMLMGLSKPVGAGQKVPITLVVETKGRKSRVEVQADVRPLGQ